MSNAVQNAAVADVAVAADLSSAGKLAGGTGPPQATGRRYKGMAVPFFFCDASADAFREMETQLDDVIVASLPKVGICNRVSSRQIKMKGIAPSYHALH